MVDERGARYPLTIDPIAQQAYVKASNTEEEDVFGTSVAVWGDTVVVGAYESSNATGVNGNESDDTAYGAGAVYVFVRNGTNWTQQAYLKASNAGTFDFFGTSVSVSGDTVVVGAYGEASNATGVNGNQTNNSATNSGAAYIFTGLGAGTSPLPVTLDIANLGGAVRLSWYTNAEGFTLETNGPAFNPASWTPLGVTPAIVSDKFVVTNAINTPARFFRLRKP